MRKLTHNQWLLFMAWWKMDHREPGSLRYEVARDDAAELLLKESLPYSKLRRMYRRTTAKWLPPIRPRDMALPGCFGLPE